MDFTLRQLVYFLAVAQHGSLTAAADAVHLSQSAMSNAIAELERSMGVKLVVRQASRGMFLTTAGELLVTKATRLLEDAEELAAQVRSTDLLLRGPLRVGCYSSLVPTVMPAVLSAFMSKYPEVQVHLQEGTEGDLVSWLRSGECDLIVTYGVRLPDDTIFDPLVTLRSYVLLSTEHPLAAQDSVTVTDLQDTPLIILDLPPSGGFFNHILQSYGVTQAPKFKSTNVNVVRSLVANNLGYTILTQPSLGLGGPDGPASLKAFPIDLPSAEVDVGVAKLAATTLTRRAQAFYSVLEKMIADQILMEPVTEEATGEKKKG